MKIGILSFPVLVYKPVNWIPFKKNNITLLLELVIVTS